MEDKHKSQPKERDCEIVDRIHPARDTFECIPKFRFPSKEDKFYLIKER
jgi:hypothetical protein